MALFKAKLARFYGWTDAYINSLTHAVAVDYWIAMSVIESDELIKSSQAASMHAFSKKGRKDYYSELNKNMKLVEKEKTGETVSTQDAALQLANAMIGR